MNGNILGMSKTEYDLEASITYVPVFTWLVMLELAASTTKGFIKISYYIKSQQTVLRGLFGGDRCLLPVSGFY